MSSKDESRESFLALSAALTGFNRVELLGTGQAEHYFAEVVAILGEEICGELWSVTVGIFRQKHDSEQELEKAIRREILADPKLGPVAKNITMKPTSIITMRPGTRYRIRRIRTTPTRRSKTSCRSRT
jgi:hypothetical protein